MSMRALPDLLGFYEHYGVRITFVGEDGDHVVALGHHEPRRFVAALNRHVRRDLRWRSLSWEWDRPKYDEVAKDVEQRWAVLVTECDEHDANEPECLRCREIAEAGWWLRWGSDMATADAFPVTVLTR